MKDASILKMAAIVCRDIAVNGLPIMSAERSQPEDEADSGWQFLCGNGEEDWESAQVWAIEEVLNRERSLSNFIEFPVGTVLTRSSPNGKWVASNKQQ